jgi:glycosyltransferase involved in cell wall biosynthesis
MALDLKEDGLVRICLVYDCLFPWTIGGAERWYRNLGERLTAEGHQVTYLTLRQWEEPPRINGIDVIAVGPKMALYRNGKRRLLPPLQFGLGVLFHLLRHGSCYDIVHTASFPYFSLLAAGLARSAGGYRIICDWHEVWSRAYWTEYLGPLGRIGTLIQTLCARVPQKAYAFSRLHKERLRTLGVKSVTQLTGQYAPHRQPICHPNASVPHTVVYAGRFIPEKRVDLLVEALALVREQIPDLRAQLIGDGPTRSDVVAHIAALGLGNVVSCPGFVSSEDLDEAMASALCVVQPSRREGYGMVVIEAAHRGVPVIVVAAPDNAATELVADGRNGFVVQTPEPKLVASAIAECERRGAALRRSTREWYIEHEKRLSLEASLVVVVEDYGVGLVAEQTETIKVGHA